LTVRTPFKSNDRRKIFENILTVKIKIELKKEINWDFKDFRIILFKLDYFLRI
jgi:hypothetical protein